MRKIVIRERGVGLSIEKLPPYIVLPGLHANREKRDGTRLDPGICETLSPGFYRPEYPLSPSEARKRLEIMRRDGLPELETMRHGLDLAADAENLKLKKELADLADFAETRAPRESIEDDLALERAQEWLLRIWLMEETALDIARLEAECRRVGQSLADNFGEGSSEASEFLPETDPALLPPWRVCAKNAMYFCPPELPVLVEGAMESDLAETFEFAPSREIDKSLGDDLLALASPLWQILGLRAPIMVQGAKAEIFNCRRIWLRRAKDGK